MSVFDALGGLVEGAADTTGDAAGEVLGGTFGPLGNFILQLSVILVVGALTVAVVG